MNTSYTTQMDAARKGILTPQMAQVLEHENISQAQLMEKLAKGHIAIPANKNHINLKAAGVGQGLKTKINVNLGVSKDVCSFDAEMNKAHMAIEFKADAVMDLSVSGDTEGFRKRLVSEIPVMIGTVPIYDTLTRTGKPTEDITIEDWFETVEIHGRNGVDFITIHAGLTRKCAVSLRTNPRLCGIVSRGGAILFEWMEKTGKENPFYEHFDRLLAACEKYDMCISLGDGLRPGCIKDSTDAPQIEELITLGELTKRAWAKNVQVMIEGPGHVPLHEVEMNMKLQKKLCHNAPFYVLGPLVTDIAPGYDHITSAIGGALAAMHGADFLCYVTPAEHLRLPSAEDVKEGIMASRIAAHAGDLAKGIKGAQDLDNKMSKARGELDWEGQFECAIDPEKARAYRKSSQPSEKDVCTMCGDFCAVKRVNALL
ncbi:MAG: phosphomethylpyrimidine synthase ThiC [Proteobacteria bacterium]|nr:phosphomethylpyrimidine synthase ThiC [Pseudomonadota bacterium]MBU1390020.1 phosphomethylpyrimidine synthase ThiC [Pseudomonadota bacterium]MBU1545029.1 phosphomethylpyrimidine synthase ThiC [Pseudomonadota bacterium]MBU2430933.1 phosphomethylpyrimidine synthase ThiC [Pseudomonadota bacterium]MBU2480367.1 phosphomethylpyrimidine synthase ThiC [Pseudomonadota bacterium]